MKGELPGVLKSTSTLLFIAPITNPQSMGLSKRYVQLILAGLCVRIDADRRVDAMSRWDEYLDQVVHAINTRVLKIYGYTLSQLLMGFNMRFHLLDQTLTEELRKERLQEIVGRDVVHRGERVHGKEREMREYHLRLAQVDKMRELTRERMLQHCEDEVEGFSLLYYKSPIVGDLVLRRRFNIDKSLCMKLYKKWDCPYSLSRISRSGVFGYVRDLKTDKLIGRYALDSLKAFVPRE